MGAAIFYIYGFVFTALSLRNISYALVALSCMFAFEQWGGINIEFVSQNGAIVNLMIIALVCVSWLRTPVASFAEIINYRIRLVLSFFLFYVFASTQWAPFDAQSASRFFDSIVYLVIVTLVAPLLIGKSRDITTYLDYLTWIGGFLVVLFAFVPSFEGRGIVYEYDFEETLSLPLTLGSFAGTVMLITVLRVKPKFLSIVWASVVFGSAIYLTAKTGSRGQLIFALGALVICAPIRWKRVSLNRTLTLILLGAIAGGAFYIVKNTENTLSSRLERGTEATEVRVRMVNVLLDTWSTSDPMTLAFGLGSSASWSRDLVGFYPHVVPLEILGELGIFGFLLFSFVVLNLFFMAYGGKQKGLISDQARTDYGALFAAFVFALLISCKQGSLLNSTDLFLYAVLAEKCFVLGLIEAKYNIIRKRKRRRRSKRPEELIDSEFAPLPVAK